jgi:inosine-uridine nucleoside N-ribohydrolase
LAIPVIIDTDPGIDDALAIFLACAAPELDIRAVTTVAGNVGINRTTRNAAHLLSLGGRSHVPVHRGADRPLRQELATIEDIHGQNGLGGVELPGTAPAPAEGSATEALIRHLAAAAPESLTIVLLGPQTNLALALQKQPGIARAVREFVVMGGSLDPEGGNSTRYAEFNIHTDPEAAAIVLAAGRPMTWIPLEVARQASVDRAWIEALRAGGGPCALAGAAMLDFYLRAFDRPQAALYDPLTVLWLIAPELFDLRPATLEIETLDAARAGQTRFDLATSASQIRVATRCDDRAVRTRLLERLLRL